MLLCELDVMDYAVTMEAICLSDMNAEGEYFDGSDLYYDWKEPEPFDENGIYY